MKKICAILLLVVLVFSLVGCDNNSTDDTITVPDIVNTDEATAKNVLSSNGLIPSIQYEYNDTITEGNVIKTEAESGATVNKNGKVVVYVSKGPSYMTASASRIQWYNLSDEADKWEFYNPYIENGVLYIQCHTVTFGCDMEWKDQYNYGNIIGIASVNDKFEKTIPVSAKYEKQSWSANEAQGFTLEIPLKDLDVSRPTDMYLQLYTVDDGNVKVNFYMTW